MAYSLLTTLDKKLGRVLVIERGGNGTSLNEDEDKSCLISGHHFHGHQTGRYFNVGGSSSHWGGQALPLNDDDFSYREWIPYSGWPITHDDVHPYIQKAEELLGVHKSAYENGSYTLKHLSPLSIDSTCLSFHYSKWSPNPNLTSKILERCQKDDRVNLLMDSVATSLTFDPQTKKIRSLTLRDSMGREAEVYARKFVLAAGGIENARLLLLSPSLPSNQYIGRMFQDHPSAQVATILSDDNRRLQQYFNYFYLNGIRCLPRLSLHPKAQQNQQLLAATAFIQFIPKANSPIESVKNVYREIRRRKFPSRKKTWEALKILWHLPKMISMFHAYFFGHFIYLPEAEPRLTIMVEQEPNRNSQIKLSSEKDRYGIPKAIVHWQISDHTLLTVQRFCSILADELAKMNLGHILWEPWVFQGKTEIDRQLHDAYHHMGTTRMSHDEDKGVVDANCKMHGVENLWIAGTSVFTTSGHSNPTLTAMALALRLGDHLQTAFSADR